LLTQTIYRICFYLLFLWSISASLVYTLESKNLLAYSWRYLPYIFACFIIYPLIWFRPHLKNLKFNLNPNVIIVLLLVIFSYMVSNFYWYDYPLRDLFSSTHYMKGALELNRFNLYNPLTADSYLPTMQIALAVMDKVTPFNILTIVWIMPIFNILLFVMIAYLMGSVFSTVEKNKPFFIFGLASLSFPIYYSPTLLAFFAATVFLHKLKCFLEKDVSKKSLILKYILLSTFILVSVFAAKFLFYNKSYWVFALGITGFVSIFERKYTPLFLLCLISNSFHRIAPLFLGLSLVILFISKKFYELDKSKLPSKTTLAFLLGNLVLIGLPPVLAVLEKEFNLSIKTDYFWEVINSVVEVFFGYRLNPHDVLSSGGGFLESFIEWIRSFPPSAYILLMGVISQKLIKRDFTKRDIFLLSSFVLFAFIMNSGLPFAYRGSVYSLILFIILSFNFFYYLDDNLKKCLFFLLLASTLTLCIFLVSPLTGEHSIYLKNNPSFFVIHLLLIAGLYTVTRKFKKHSWLILVFAIFYMERQILVTFFYKYSYGMPPQKSKVITHYTQNDLALARNVLQRKYQYIFSDPITMSIVKSTTGQNGSYSYQNINGLEPDRKLMVKEALLKIIKCDEKSFANILKQIIDYSFSAEAMYFSRKKYSTSGTGVTNNIIDNTLVVISESTLNWINCPECSGYFPKNAGLTISSDCFESVLINNQKYYLKEITLPQKMRSQAQDR